VEGLVHPPARLEDRGQEVAATYGLLKKVRSAAAQWM
jgi:hypothetical protein